MLKFLLGVATGWAAAWFLDPNDGARRRNVTRGKAMSYARQGGLNDPTQAHKVESEGFRSSDAPKEKVSVSVQGTQAPTVS